MIPSVNVLKLISTQTTTTDAQRGKHSYSFIGRYINIKIGLSEFKKTKFVLGTLKHSYSN